MIAKPVIDTSLRYNGVHVIGYESKYFYFVTNTKEVIEYYNVENKEELSSDDVKFKTFDIKYGKYRDLEYEKVTDLFMICVPLFSSPRISEIEEKPTQEVLENSKIFINKFKVLDKSLFSDESDMSVAHPVNAFVKANAKNDNLFPVDIDSLDVQIILHDKGIASHIYNNNRDIVDFFSTEVGVLLEFFEPEVKNRLKELLLSSKQDALSFLKDCWRTILEIYRAKSVDLFEKQIEEVNANTTMEDFEKEYALNSIQNEKERVSKLDHEPFLNLLDDPNQLIKYWPYTNINLESTDTVVINLGGSTVEEKFGGKRPNKNIIVSNDYFFKLINIIKRYIPEEKFTIKDCRGLFTESAIKDDPSIPQEQKDKIKHIKESLVAAKKVKLVSVKEKMLESLKKELNEVSEEEIKKEIQEIITLIESTQEEINSLQAQHSIVDILDFWPPALYPMPNELNPNQ